MLTPNEVNKASEICFERCARRHGTLRKGATGKALTTDITRQRGYQSLRDVITIDLPGPGGCLRSQENSPYVWADVFFGPNRDAMQVIDKQTLKIVKTLRPVPGATAAHVEVDRLGRHALVSIWEDDGAVIVYDAKTLEEVKRLPMRKPPGKYNVWNEITFSDGTGH